MLLANTIRVSQTTQSAYHQFFNERKSELLRLDGKLAEVQKETWEDLKSKKRG